MHRIPAMPGGWNPDTEGVIIIEQNPAPIIFLTSADTDIQTVASCLDFLPADFPDIRVANLLQLQQELTIDTYADEILSHAQVIILRLLGGKSYWSYGLEVCKEIVENTGASLFILPGDDRPDPQLLSNSNLPLQQVNQLWQYFIEGGVYNFLNAFKYVIDICFDTDLQPFPPQIVPRLGIYSVGVEYHSTLDNSTLKEQSRKKVPFGRDVAMLRRGDLGGFNHENITPPNPPLQGGESVREDVFQGRKAGTEDALQAREAVREDVLQGGELDVKSIDKQIQKK